MRGREKKEGEILNLSGKMNEERMHWTYGQHDRMKRQRLEISLAMNGEEGGGGEGYESVGEGGDASGLIMKVLAPPA